MSIEHSKMMALDAQHENRCCSDCEYYSKRDKNDIGVCILLNVPHTPSWRCVHFTKKTEKK